MQPASIHMSHQPDRIGKALLALHSTHAHRAAASYLGGIGVIFMLHRVCPDTGAEFAPNRLLEITPQFLDETITLVRELGYHTLSLSEATRRISAGETGERFAVFTLDDGYRDNYTQALPVFVRQQTPFTVYLATDMPDGTAEIWWVALERAIAATNEICARLSGHDCVMSTRSAREKQAAYDRIYWHLRAQPEATLRAEVRRLAAAHDIDMAGLTRELAMSWDELRGLNAQPLAGIEAHTASHVALAAQSPQAARHDIARGLARHEAELGNRPTHFSYPYGDAESAGKRDFELARSFGFFSATTTRKGLIQRHHAKNMMRLPRLSLNGLYQDRRMLEVLLSGLPFAMAKPFGLMGVDSPDHRWWRRPSGAGLVANG